MDSAKCSLNGLKLYEITRNHASEMEGLQQSILTLFYSGDLMVVKHLGGWGGDKITLPTKNAPLVDSGLIPLAHM